HAARVGLWSALLGARGRDVRGQPPRPSRRTAARQRRRHAGGLLMSGRLGVLIAGGAGERFGGPKALARFHGATLVARAHAVLAEVCDDVVVVAPETLDLPVPATSRVPDRIAGEGPLSALVAGLSARAFTCAFA